MLLLRMYGKDRRFVRVKLVRANLTILRDYRCRRASVAGSPIHNNKLWDNNIFFIALGKIFFRIGRKFCQTSAVFKVYEKF